MTVQRFLALLAFGMAVLLLGRGVCVTHAGEEWDGRRIEELVRQLKDDEYLRREDASRKLAGAPAAVLPILERLAQDVDDPEAGQRMMTVARTIFLNRVAPFLPEWKKSRGFLGIRWTVGEDEPGVMVQEVIADTAADRSGIQNGDVILSANGNRFEKGMTQEEAMRVWRQMLPGDQLKLVIKKAEKEEPVKMTVVVGSLPAEYQYETSEEEKEEKLWTRYRAGLLQLPNEVQGNAHAGERSSRQSWPNVLQTPSTPPAQGMPVP